MDYYKQIFKRKSFHLFKDTGTITSYYMSFAELFSKAGYYRYTQLSPMLPH